MIKSRVTKHRFAKIQSVQIFSPGSAQESSQSFSHLSPLSPEPPPPPPPTITIAHTDAKPISNNTSANLLSKSSSSSSLGRSASVRPPSPSNTPLSDADSSFTENDPLLHQDTHKNGRPKRPLNSFMIFSRKRRPELKLENEDMTVAGVAKLLSQEWKDMTIVSGTPLHLSGSDRVLMYAIFFLRTTRRDMQTQLKWSRIISIKPTRTIDTSDEHPTQKPRAAPLPVDPKNAGLVLRPLRPAPMRQDGLLLPRPYLLE